jgi:hypothetical protein
MTAGTNITSSHTILLNTFQLGIGGAISGGASVAIFNNASSGPALTASAVSDASSPAFSAQNTGDGDAMFVVKNGTETSTTASVGSFFANGGTVANGFGGHLNYYAETSVQARIAGKFKWWWSDKTDATRTSQIDLWGVNSATDERYMNIQADGTVRVNNDADTLAKLSDVRSMEVGGSTPSLNKAITLYFPSSSENTTMWTVPVDITITSVVAVNVGSSSPSVTFQVAFGTDRTSGTNVFSSGRTVTSTTTVHTFNSSFNDATIPAGSIIWITTSAQSGTVNETNITINYTED